MAAQTWPHPQPVSLTRCVWGPGQHTLAPVNQARHTHSDQPCCFGLQGEMFGGVEGPTRGRRGNKQTWWLPPIHCRWATCWWKDAGGNKATHLQGSRCLEFVGHQARELSGVVVEVKGAAWAVVVVRGMDCWGEGA
jgi:hypothetical protein